jgi:hypothetical protein
MLPLAGIVAGGALSMAPKIGSMGLGLAGGATAIGIEQIQMAVQISKNRPKETTTGVGALLEANDVRALPSGTGYAEEDEDSGALWGAANVYRGEAAGLSL